MQCFYPTSEAEWRKLRLPRIGSTESPALFGYSPYQTAYELGVAKRTGLDRDIANERTKWGQRLQGVIADAFEEEHGVRVERADHRYYANDDIRMGASVDYIIKGSFADTREVGRLYNELGPGVLEIKNVDKWVAADQWAEGLPAHIEMQLQHQLAVTDLRWGVIFALFGGNEPYIAIREAKPIIKELLEGNIQKFWYDFERGNLPDPMMPKDAKAMAALYGTATPAKVFDALNDEKLQTLAAEYHAWRQKAKFADESSATAKAYILQHIGDAERVVNLKGYNLSAKMVEGAHVEYDRDPYRNFRLTESKRATPAA